MQLKFLTLASIACLVASASAAPGTGLDSTTINSYEKATLRGAQLIRRQEKPDCTGIDPDLINMLKEDPEGQPLLKDYIKQLKELGKKMSSPEVVKEAKDEVQKVDEEQKKKP